MSELGNRLKQAREERNISLDDLQAITKIQKRYLLGIEEGNYSMMPGKFYARAFIKQYAEAVNLNADDLFEEFKNEVPTTYKEDVPEQLSRVKTQRELPKTASKFVELLPKFGLILLILIIAVGFWIWRQTAAVNDQGNENETNITEVSDSEFEKIDNVSSEDETETETADEDPAAVDEESAPPEEEKPVQTLTFKEVKGTNTVYELSGTDKFELEVIAKDRTWVGIKNGKGKTFFGEEIPKGETQTNDFSAETEITVRVGNVPGTDLKINGELLKYEDTKKTPQNITIIYMKE
ncbi:cytoskeletal protein RodZ [Metabacillus crassostreae]|uniref:helix-turn-helix domain-containing protein n=1 Tax=Metabacillus crassostreae TaxID=929098 RepID=UPI00195B0EB8|nr:RodZ family helix-turn-helix domain-containing protein [Metabacillus crassostreae]MBM7603251.1 cytoskeletal protein RodZ [Metabacillus crassostreae]